MASTLFATTLVQADHRRSFQVHAAPVEGWDVVEERDECVVRLMHCADWHRVEHALALFEREIEGLRHEGWQEALTPESKR